MTIDKKGRKYKKCKKYIETLSIMVRSWIGKILKKCIVLIRNSINPTSNIGQNLTNNSYGSVLNIWATNNINPTGNMK